jgi:ribosomal protein S14
MLSSKIKDISLRQKFLKVEKLKKIQKFLYINLLSKKRDSFNFNSNFFLSSKYNKRISKVRINNICVYTNRNKGVSKYFSLSRLSQRDLMQFGNIPGYVKAVW